MVKKRKIKKELKLDFKKLREEKISVGDFRRRIGLSKTKKRRKKK